MNTAQLKRLVGNPDAYARQKEDGSWYPVREPLTKDVLQAHLNKDITVGTYVLDGSMARTLVFDLDEGVGEENLRTAEMIAEALEDLGVPSRGIAIEFSGGKGYHVWVVFADYVEAADLRRLGRAVLGITAIKCEVFPKQDRVKDLGNLVKLPGGLHRKTGNENEFIDKPPVGISQQILNQILEDLPEEPTVSGVETEGMFACMHHLQTEGPSEGWRNNGLYHLAVMLRRGGVIEENVVEIVTRAWQKANEDTMDPVTEEELNNLLESSKDGGPMCHNIPGEAHCGEHCIAVRHKGLHVRKGEFKYGQEGEVKTVAIKRRRGKMLELEHPDLAQGKVVLE